MHAGSTFNKGAMGTWSDCNISDFFQYKAANMLKGGMKIYSVPKNQNQETQIILLSATKPDKVLEVSTWFMRDHIWFMITREEQALEVILQIYIYVKREECKQATMCDLYENVTITQTVSPHNTRTQVDRITEGTHKMDFKVSDVPGNEVKWITR